MDTLIIEFKLSTISIKAHLLPQLNWNAFVDALLYFKSSFYHWIFLLKSQQL